MPYTLEDVRRRIEDAIPALSPTATKVIRLAGDLNCPPSELTKAIKLDAVLSARVLRLVNSAYFYPVAKIVSLERAVIMLGLNTIKNLALSAAVLALMNKSRKEYAFSVRAFWKHSLAVGVAAKQIALKRGIPRARIEDYFVAGLLHNLGILVENRLFPEEMPRIIQRAGSGDLCAAEEAELEGLNHCLIAKALAARWNLSSDVASVMEHYRFPGVQGENADLVMTVHLASLICRNQRLGLVLEKTPLEVAPSVYARLEVDPAIQTEILARMEGEIDKSMEFLRQ
jgi:HD-like signal output (HDOD) protein